MAGLRKELDKRGLLTAPLVYLHPSCGEATARLEAAVRKLQGQLADSAGGAWRMGRGCDSCRAGQLREKFVVAAGVAD